MDQQLQSWILGIPQYVQSLFLVWFAWNPSWKHKILKDKFLKTTNHPTSNDRGIHRRPIFLMSPQPSAHELSIHPITKKVAVIEIDLVSSQHKKSLNSCLMAHELHTYHSSLIIAKTTEYKSTVTS